MSSGLAHLLVLAVALAAFVVARGRATGLRTAGAQGQRLNSLPFYHGAYAFLWAIVPAGLFLALWAPLKEGLVQQSVLASPAGQQLPDFDLARDSILSEARAVATGASDLAFTPLAQSLVPVYEAALGRYGLIGSGFALLLAIIGAGYALSRIR